MCLFFFSPQYVLPTSLRIHMPLFHNAPQCQPGETIQSKHSTGIPSLTHRVVKRVNILLPFRNSSYYPFTTAKPRIFRWVSAGRIQTSRRLRDEICCFPHEGRLSRARFQRPSHNHPLVQPRGRIGYLPRKRNPLFCTNTLDGQSIVPGLTARSLSSARESLVKGSLCIARARGLSLSSVACARRHRETDAHWNPTDLISL